MLSYIINLLLFCHYMLWIIKILPWRPQRNMWFRRGGQSVNRCLKLCLRKAAISAEIVRKQTCTDRCDFLFQGTLHKRDTKRNGRVYCSSMRRSSWVSRTFHLVGKNHSEQVMVIVVSSLANITRGREARDGIAAARLLSTSLPCTDLRAVP